MTIDDPIQPNNGAIAESTDLSVNKQSPPLESNIVPAPDGSVVKLGNLRSASFIQGEAGWRIKANGDVEFNDGTFRGTITATAGTIGGWTISAHSIIGGDQSGDPGTQYLELDDDGSIQSFVSGEVRAVFNGFGLTLIAPSNAPGAILASFGASRLDIDLGNTASDYAFTTVGLVPFDNTYLLGDDRALFLSGWKGLVLNDTTNTDIYRIEIIAGVLTTTGPL